MSSRQITSDKPKPNPWPWRRHALGVITVLLLVGGVCFSIWEPTGGQGLELQSACWRIGSLCGVFWLAYEQLQRIPIWVWPMLPVLLLIVARRPQWLLFLIPLLVLVGFLRPRKPKRG